MRLLIESVPSGYGQDQMSLEMESALNNKKAQ